MTKEEFISKLRQISEGSASAPENLPLPTDQEYGIIEMVYTFYPTVSNTDGKCQVAWLYRMFGMSIFYDMLPRARMARAKEDELLRLRWKLDQAQREMEQIHSGCLVHPDGNGAGTTAKFSELQNQKEREDCYDGN